VVFDFEIVKIRKLFLFFLNF